MAKRMVDEHNELAREIRQCFSQWSKPKIVIAECLRLSNDEELDKVHELLLADEWNTIDCDVFRLGYPAAGLMSKAVFTYCLPSYLLCVIAPSAEYELILELVNRIGPPAQKGTLPVLGFDLARFDPAQLEVIVRTLVFLKDMIFDEETRIRRRIERTVQVLEQHIRQQ